MEIFKNPLFSRFFVKENFFFETFNRECWIVTLLAPFTIILPSLLMKMAMEASSFFVALLLFFIYLIALLPWVLIPTWFLLFKTEPETKMRKFAYSWMGVIGIAIVSWIIIL